MTFGLASDSDTLGFGCSHENSLGPQKHQIWFREDPPFRPTEVSWELHWNETCSHTKEGWWNVGEPLSFVGSEMGVVQGCFSKKAFMYVYLILDFGQLLLFADGSQISLITIEMFKTP